MHCVMLRISLKSPRAVYLRAVTNIYTHVARVPFHPVQNLTFSKRTSLATHLVCKNYKHLLFYIPLTINNKTTQFVCVSLKKPSLLNHTHKKLSDKYFTELGKNFRVPENLFSYDYIHHLSKPFLQKVQHAGSLWLARSWSRLRRSSTFQYVPPPHVSPLTLHLLHLHSLSPPPYHSGSSRSSVHGNVKWEPIRFNIILNKTGRHLVPLWFNSPSLSTLTQK